MTIENVADIKNNNDIMVGHWVSEDSQSSIDMTGMSAPMAFAELYTMCADDEQRANILAGSFEVVGTC
jgi:hypothetical protein